MSFGDELAAIYRRDLARLKQQITAFPDNGTLWQTLPGITHSAGNLTLHVEGNLREYVGRQRGNRPYERNRPVQFSASGVAPKELTARLDSLSNLMAEVFGDLTDDRMVDAFQEDFLGGADCPRGRRWFT